VDATGVYPLSWSLDHVGPITRTVRDAGRLLDVLAPVPGDSCEGAAIAGRRAGLGGVRVGVARAWLESGIQAGVAERFEAALTTLAGIGAGVRDTALPASAELLMAVNRAITLPEASAWHAPYLAAGRSSEYGANVRPRMQAGLQVPAVLYLQALRLRTHLAALFAALWEDVDLIALPTVPVVAPPIGSPSVDLGGGRQGPTVMALLAWDGPFNVLGTPALSLPCGRTPEGLPVGLQLVAAPAEDAFLCFAGAAAEAALAFGRMRPPLAAH
jgi:aspartyl-tRNA(Asn)/glutamyl-tRNA(Gln) amidotransferase subunit A